MQPWRSTLWYALILGMAVGATLLSLFYLNPATCRTVCQEPKQTPCPRASCRHGEQQAGFPFPMVRDQASSSPTSGWGKISPDDFVYANPVAFLGNVLFYSVLIGLLWMMREVWRSTTAVGARIGVVLIVTLSPIGLCLLLSYLSSPRWTPPDTSRPYTAILGTWKGTDASGKELMVRFYDTGMTTIAFPRFSGAIGEYTWIDDDSIRLTFTQNSPPGGASQNLCAHAPTFVKGICRTKMIDPAAYPVPVGGSAPHTSPSGPGAYPSPPRPVEEVAAIDDLFRVSVDSQTLTFTDPSGVSQTFRRVISGG